jgi:hypothetical protein
MPERRKNLRHDKQLDAELSYSNVKKVSTKVLNIGIGGVYAQVSDTELPAIGELVNITFHVDIDGEKEHVFSLKVVRIDDHGHDFRIALKLLNVDEKYLVFLGRIIEEMLKK